MNLTVCYSETGKQLIIMNSFPIDQRVVHKNYSYTLISKKDVQLQMHVEYATDTIVYKQLFEHNLYTVDRCMYIAMHLR